MGGQDGYSRDLLDYNEEASSLLAGVSIHPTDRWRFGIDFGYTEAEAALDPFDLPADDYVAITPPTSYDFSRSHTYSDLDVDRLNLDATLKYTFNEAIWMRLWYRFVDYNDNAPFLYDTTGSVQWVSASVGWAF